MLGYSQQREGGGGVCGVGMSNLLIDMNTMVQGV